MVKGECILWLFDSAVNLIFIEIKEQINVKIKLTLIQHVCT